MTAAMPGRAQVLAALPGVLARHAPELDAAIVAERGYPAASVRRDREGLLADAARAATGADPAAGRAPLTGRNGGDRYLLCVLSYNIGYWALVPVLNCVLPGNHVRLRFPRGADRIAAAMLAVLHDLVGPDRVVVDDRPGRELARAAAEDPGCAGVCLYGSDRAGWGFRGAAEAGVVVVVEGPGNDPALVLPDAAPDVAARLTAMKYAYGSGQACVAPERILVARSRYAEVVDGLAAAAAELVVGDPADPRVDVGPILHTGVLARLREQLDDAVAHGAQVVTGKLDADGSARPTVVAGLTPAMRAMTEEVFGPVVYVAPVEDDDEAVELAAASSMGLSASVWGRRGAEAVAARLRGAPALEQVDAPVTGRFGLVSVNRPGTANSLHIPFGGYGRSGWVWRPDPGEPPTFWQGPKHLGRVFSR
ncbi:aldehyde dehydrogenase family protein [Pseudonocardia bannensis]|uniref:Aldehyde dehydrogenase n=1 Tax=Pseudonocardia bannensis TaxID=630973 RepID=A0A848DDC1_9PSEU|nr:aldehyde dehydrogenase family protein [Pseudonocardia bannensis]NMH90562.1 aldehyde dehydrogenase [Pseudonocardia bannensis]